MSEARLVRNISVAFAAAVIAAGCAHFSQPEEITVKRINLVDSSGETRLVISGDLPDPVVRGERIERAITPAGILWHDEDGDESGGLAVAPVPAWHGAPNGKVRMLTFDFTHQITDAVRLGTYESDDGTAWEGGLTVYDRRPFSSGPIESSQGTRRIYLGTQNEDAGLVILDSEERERIRIGVGQDDVAVIEILDEAGEVVYRIPE
ncbi:hypothetical protein [Lysobacter sp. D1-1-M9]|uniref:hypothetical protein n=1 Tax=Novilysobacter longmucuonensis TaxID=3098603 RepID=UPI002FCA1073